MKSLINLDIPTVGFDYIDNQNVSEICDSADDYFYKNEQVIIDILQDYANSLSYNSKSD